MTPENSPPGATPPDDGGRNPAAPDPYMASGNRARERMGADSNPDLDPRRPMEPSEGTRPRASAGRAGLDVRALLARMAGSNLLGTDPMTRRLVYGAAGLGGVLVVAIGGWSLFGHHQGGIPVLGPPPGPVRVKPADPGGMQILGAADGMSADGGVMRLSPPPEQPQPDAMARQYGQNAGADTPPAPNGGNNGGNVAAPPPAPSATPPAAVAPTPPPATAPVAPAPAPLPAPQAEAPAPAHLPPPVPRALNTGDGAYGVQLAALDTQAAAMKSWNSLTSRYPGVFGDYRPAVVKAERNGRTFYRLRIRGLDRAQATALCAKVRAKSLPCDPVHS
ncbi:SPOR domain-containing protein [Komagataeibacter sp. FNDCR2]|uniref:SPOR domain-containing protein n=1 Tax=Komagataeibacter sp. FNDCR2 TaxID=2878682 RepID=UPI001E5533FA|nr:SPOR domain-containing protein [Komagataeibacter sp. FNDCR2]MCE2576314.1 SPOR domain-containing protein [Komagataeibacter sp. FNDCR2]